MKNYCRLTVAACLEHPVGFEDSVEGRVMQVHVPLPSGRMAALGASLLSLIAISFASLGLWGIGADLDLAGDFVLQSGLLSHWQVWIGAAVGTQYAGVLLIRHAKTPRCLLEVGMDVGAIAQVSGAPTPQSATA